MTHKSLISKMQLEGKAICEYCGKTKNELSFVIGASNKPDWTMIQGTGKMTCPDCYERAMTEGQEAIEKHCNWVNKSAQEGI